MDLLPIDCGDRNHIGRMRRQNQYRQLMVNETYATCRIVGYPEVIGMANRGSPAAKNHARL